MSVILNALQKSEAERRRGQPSAAPPADAARAAPQIRIRRKWLWSGVIAGNVAAAGLVIWLMSVDRSVPSIETVSDPLPGPPAELVADWLIAVPTIDHQPAMPAADQPAIAPSPGRPVSAMLAKQYRPDESSPSQVEMISTHAELASHRAVPVVPPPVDATADPAVLASLAAGMTRPNVPDRMSTLALSGDEISGLAEIPRDEAYPELAMAPSLRVVAEPGMQVIPDKPAAIAAGPRADVGSGRPQVWNRPATQEVLTSTAPLIAADSVLLAHAEAPSRPFSTAVGSPWPGPAPPAAIVGVRAHVPPRVAVHRDLVAPPSIAWLRGRAASLASADGATMGRNLAVISSPAPGSPDELASHILPGDHTDPPTMSVVDSAQMRLAAPSAPLILAAARPPFATPRRLTSALGNGAAPIIRSIEPVAAPPSIDVVRGAPSLGAHPAPIADVAFTDMPAAQSTLAAARPPRVLDTVAGVPIYDPIPRATVVDRVAVAQGPTSVVPAIDLWAAVADLSPLAPPTEVDEPGAGASYPEVGVPTAGVAVVNWRHNDLPGDRTAPRRISPSPIQNRPRVASMMARPPTVLALLPPPDVVAPRPARRRDPPTDNGATVAGGSDPVDPVGSAASGRPDAPLETAPAPEPDQAAPTQPVKTAAIPPTKSAPQPDPLADIPLLRHMPQRFASQVPPIRVSLHVYAADSVERLVRLNGKVYREGERTDDGVTLELILPDGLVMRYQGRPFRVGL